MDGGEAAGDRDPCLSQALLRMDIAHLDSIGFAQKRKTYATLVPISFAGTKNERTESDSSARTIQGCHSGIPQTNDKRTTQFSRKRTSNFVETLPTYLTEK
jgi:hypothetical protein